MSDTMTAAPKPEAARNGSADKDAIAEVEKWMALIREISREQAKS
jgi:hypothetical protein